VSTVAIRGVAIRGVAIRSIRVKKGRLHVYRAEMSHVEEVFTVAIKGMYLILGEGLAVENEPRPWTGYARFVRA
jgi:hypothetical protein